MRNGTVAASMSPLGSVDWLKLKLHCLFVLFLATTELLLMNPTKVSHLISVCIHRQSFLDDRNVYN
jgi:hypothetical protein